MRDVTLDELKKILSDKNIEYYVASCINGLVKINILVKDEIQK